MGAGGGGMWGVMNDEMGSIFKYVFVLFSPFLDRDGRSEAQC